MELWIVGRMHDGGAWEFMGVFDDRNVAISKCVIDDDFIAPAILNEELPQEQMEWDGCFYPLIEG